MILLEKRYKEPNRIEMETTINVLYEENVISIYTNKPDLQIGIGRGTMAIDYQILVDLKKRLQQEKDS